MAVIVQPVGRIFTVKISHEDESIEFGFKQLDYKTRGDITAAVSTVKQGQFMIDSSLQVFLNIKHGLKIVKGLVDEDGKPYQLKFEDNSKKELTDECVDELLATVLSDNLQFAAREMASSSMPTEIRHPLTGKPLEGVEVILPKKGDGVQKK